MFRTCKHCGLFSLHGEYCAGCGKHLQSKPFIAIKQLLGLAVIIVVLGVLIGFLVAGSGVLKQPTSAKLALSTDVENCAGTYAYELQLEDKNGPLTNAFVTISVEGKTLEELRTDQNGRLSAVHQYPSEWCGYDKRVRATYRGNAFHERATAATSLLARIPTTLQLSSQRVGTNTAYTLTLTDSEGVPLPGEVVRLSSSTTDSYAITNSYGHAYITLQEEVLRAAFVGDESYSAAHATPALPTTADTVAVLQQHVVAVAHARGSGAGVIIKHLDGETYILTNRHVINNASTITARIADTEISAKRVLTAPHSVDLAILILNGTYGVPATNANSYRQGDAVLAIGSPLGLRGSVSTGIISNTVVDTFDGYTVTLLQTDAPINLGNSGGGLFSADGLLLGITTAKAVAAEGIGFAIDARTLNALPMQTWESRLLS